MHIQTIESPEALVGKTIAHVEVLYDKLLLVTTGREAFVLEGGFETGDDEYALHPCDRERVAHHVRTDDGIGDALVEHGVLTDCHHRGGNIR